MINLEVFFKNHFDTIYISDEVAPGAGVTVAAGTSETVTANQLGDVSLNNFLNVTNNGAVVGSCKEGASCEDAGKDINTEQALDKNAEDKRSIESRLQD